MKDGKLPWYVVTRPDNGYPVLVYAEEKNAREVAKSNGYKVTPVQSSEKRPLVGVSLIIVRDGKVLIGKRLGTHASGMWGFPGGHLEMWEAWDTCVLRELKEEVGDISVTQPRFWTAANTMFPDEGRHYVVLFMVSDYISGEPVVMERDKCECWEWRAWDDLPSPLMPGIEYVLEQGMKPF